MFKTHLNKGGNKAKTLLSNPEIHLLTSSAYAHLAKSRLDKENLEK
jgi:hypothetical protein